MHDDLLYFVNGENKRLCLTKGIIVMLQNFCTSQDPRTELDGCQKLSRQFKAFMGKISELPVIYQFTSRYGSQVESCSRTGKIALVHRDYINFS